MQKISFSGIPWEDILCIAQVYVHIPEKTSWKSHKCCQLATSNVKPMLKLPVLSIQIAAAGTLHQSRFNWVCWHLKQSTDRIFKDIFTKFVTNAPLGPGRILKNWSPNGLLKLSFKRISFKGSISRKLDQTELPNFIPIDSLFWIKHKSAF